MPAPRGGGGDDTGGGVGGAPRPLAVAPPGLTESHIQDRFARAVLTRGAEPPAVAARSVLPTMALLDAARRERPARARGRPERQGGVGAVAERRRPRAGAFIRPRRTRAAR
jgi:hypothetical protein